MIRAWQKKDIEQITSLLNQLKHDLHENNDISPDNVHEQYKKMKGNDVYTSYVYEDNNKVIGFVSVIYYRSVFHKKGTALINELVVEKENRGKGIGKKLLDYIIKEALVMEMDEIEVGVMKENENAISFYKKNGMDEEYYLLGKEFD